MQVLGLAVNALSSARPAVTLMLERSPPKIDTHRCTVDQLDLWQRLAREADAVRIPPLDLNPNAALREVLHSDDLHSVCAGTALGSYDAKRLRVTRGGLTHRRSVTWSLRKPAFSSAILGRTL